MPGELSDLKAFLDEKTNLYNRPEFIENDPISIPHSYSRKEDIEIAGFFSAIIAWGSRVSIIKSANRLMEMFDHAPYEFILHHNDSDLKAVQDFVHRTFQSSDLLTFIAALKRLYLEKEGLEGAFGLADTMDERISKFKAEFLRVSHLPRTNKHLADPMKGSAAKRINMFLRWMVRKDDRGVDFGIWDSISPSDLYCPLDVHSGRVARKLGILERKQNDWKAAEELMLALRQFDPKDPVKYDFALFGLGAIEGFIN